MLPASFIKAAQQYCKRWAQLQRFDPFTLKSKLIELTSSLLFHKLLSVPYNRLVEKEEAQSQT